LALYAQGKVGFSRNRFQSYDENTNVLIDENTSNTFQMGIRPGITYFMSKNLALETGLGFLGYSKTNSELEESDGGTFDWTRESSFFSFDLNSSNLFFGLSFYY
jgi:hypothetical protein